LYIIEFTGYITLQTGCIIYGANTPAFQNKVPKSQIFCSAHCFICLFVPAFVGVQLGPVQL